MGNHAIVFGASGLTGWAVVNQLLSGYPHKDAFSRVTACVNRPFDLAKSGWPLSKGHSSPEFTFIPHINLTKGSPEGLKAFLKEQIPDVEVATHVFFFAYKQEDNPALEVAVNSGMVERGVGAITKLSKHLQFVVVNGGARGYGIYTPGGTFKPPFVESMQDQLSPAAKAKIHYFAVRDVLDRLSAGQSWTWCETCPDIIVGFAPNGSTFSLPGHWALYLSTYALVEGKGAKVPYPGTGESYRSKFNEASADMIARFAIWAGLIPEKSRVSRHVFNVADRAEPWSMAQLWPKLTEHFGLQGLGPVEQPEKLMKPTAYLSKHKDVIAQHGVEANGIFRADFLDLFGFWTTFDRQLDLSKARSAGFDEETNPLNSWYKAFERMEQGKIIPADS